MFNSWLTHFDIQRYSNLLCCFASRCPSSGPLLSFPDGSDDKESACNAGDPGLIPGLGKSPAKGNDNPLQYSCLENSMDRPWGHKESDTTEPLTQQQHTLIVRCTQIYYVALLVNVPTMDVWHHDMHSTIKMYLG